MVLSQALFSGMGVFTRLRAQNVPWQEVALARFGIGAVVAYLMARTRGATLTITNKKLMWTRSVTGTLKILRLYRESISTLTCATFPEVIGIVGYRADFVLVILKFPGGEHKNIF